MKQYKINGVKFFERDQKQFCAISQCGVECIYPIAKPQCDFPIKYVLTDLDGTTVKSEEFWMYLIQLTAQSLLNDDSFRLAEEDIPFVSGFSTLEHLEYCIKKYNIPADGKTALAAYHKIARRELDAIAAGGGNADAFKPREGLKNFLFELKRRGIKVGLATSGLDYKAIPEIVSAFRVENMGDPLNYYDGIVTGGKQKVKQYGTIGEIAVKPHPWVYAELALGMGVDNKSQAIVLEDSSAGVLSGTLAGIPVVGFCDGNIISGNFDDMCVKTVRNFDEVLDFIDGKNN